MQTNAGCQLQNNVRQGTCFTMFLLCVQLLYVWSVALNRSQYLSCDKKTTLSLQVQSCWAPLITSQFRHHGSGHTACGRLETASWIILKCFPYGTEAAQIGLRQPWISNSLAVQLEAIVPTFGHEDSLSGFLCHSGHISLHQCNC